MNEEKKVLIYDIETGTVGSRPNPKTDIFKFFGAYDPETGEYFYLTDLESVRDLIKQYDVLVGFNTLKYDNVVLFNNGLNDIMKADHENEEATFEYKTNVDMYVVFKKRAPAMKVKKGMLGDLLMSYSLDFISKTIGIVDDADGKIKDFDYSILKKNVWTQEEYDYIIDYLKRDLEVTHKMFEWLKEYFEGFKEHVTQQDIDTYKYITCSTAVFTYKAICNRLGLPEEYSDNKSEKSFGGGYVSCPAGESFEGNIYCLDFNSLYPHILMMGNVTEPVEEGEEGWSGGKLFKTKGVYNNKVLGKIPKLYIDMYAERVAFKKVGDMREYTLKIQLNGGYGILNNPAFKSVYQPVGGADIPNLGRQFTLYARKKFREAGYHNLYSDTDSCYLLDPFNDEERLMKVKDQIIKDIKDNVPFPVDHFDMGIDDRITHMFFFKGSGDTNEAEHSDMDEDDHKYKHLNLMKKNYVYITKEGRLVYKNLGVKKKSTSSITRKIWKDNLIPKILEEKKVQFPKSYFRELIYKYLKEDISLATLRYNVKDAKDYALASQLHAQISTRYGPGIHFLIPNNITGVGKDKKYCTVEEFKEHGLTIEDINLDNVWRELGYFIKPVVERNIFSFGGNN